MGQRVCGCAGGGEGRAQACGAEGIQLCGLRGEGRARACGAEGIQLYGRRGGRREESELVRQLRESGRKAEAEPTRQRLLGRVPACPF